MESDAPEPHGMSARASVLIVEDEPSMVRFLHRALEMLGYRAAGSASTAREGVALAEALRPDVVIMDVVLEGWNAGIDAGVEIWERLHIPVVFSTARVDPAALRLVSQATPFPHLLKPFTEGELQQALEDALGRHDPGARRPPLV